MSRGLAQIGGMGSKLSLDWIYRRLGGVSRIHGGQLVSSRWSSRFFVKRPLEHLRRLLFLLDVIFDVFSLGQRLHLLSVLEEWLSKFVEVVRQDHGLIFSLPITWTVRIFI